MAGKDPTQVSMDIVIRPSGVWNSRAPYHNYLISYRRLQRAYNVLCLAVCRLTEDAQDPATASREGRKWLKAKYGSRMSGIHWRNYQRSLPRQADGQRAAPRAGETVPHLEDGIAVFKEQTVVSYVSLFETFAQTWALNVLLARLECGFGWTHAERNLSRAFSPEHSDELPSLPRILQAFPALGVGLKGLPAYVAPDQGEEAPGAVTETFNALSAVRAWRAFRNNLVHRGGMLNSRFLARHGPYVAALRLHYPYIPELRVGGRILMYDALVRSIAAEHSRAALWMSDELETVSGGRRGHPFSPNAKPAKVFFQGDPPPAPPLLMAGDHEASYGWESSAEFRTRFRETLPA